MAVKHLEPTPNQEAIEQAEDLLRRCKSGEITYFTGIAMGNSIQYDEYHFGKANDLRIIGALTMLLKKHMDWKEAAWVRGD